LQVARIVTIIFLLLVALDSFCHGSGQTNQETARGAVVLSLDPAKHDQVLKKLKQEIQQNLTLSRQRPFQKLLPLKLALYQIQPGDDLWKVIRYTSLDMDTVAHSNRLGSSHDLRVGQWLLLPNQRGTWREIHAKDTMETFRQRWQMPLLHLLSVNQKVVQIEGKRYLFVPNGQFTKLERSLFLGTAFLTPLRQGKISSGFGYRLDPFTWQKSFHGGVDLAAPQGTSVFASRYGRVVHAGWCGDLGQCVRIQHDHSYETIYGHLSAILVAKNQTISYGTLVGRVGTTGRSTGPHLHFEVRHNGRHFNPLSLLRIPR